MIAVEVPENVMRRIGIRKIVLNIGVGKSGEALERAKRVIENLVDAVPATRKAKESVRDFGVHRGEPIGAAVTLRGEKTGEIRRLLAGRSMRLPTTSFDDQGSCSFGIKEHIDIPGVKYDPDTGIFGMNVSVVLGRPGYRVMKRKRAASRVGRKHRITKDEAVNYFKQALGVEVF